MQQYALYLCYIHYIIMLSMFHMLDIESLIYGPMDKVLSLEPTTYC